MRGSLGGGGGGTDEVVVEDLSGELGRTIGLVGEDGRDEVMDGILDVRGNVDTLSPNRGFVPMVEKPPGADPDAENVGERKDWA